MPADRYCTIMLLFTLENHLNKLAAVMAGCFVFTVWAAVPNASNAQPPKTSVLLSVIEIDNSGERPAENMQIYALPKNQGAARGRTDANGKIRFEFAPTESVVFRIGAGGGQLRMQPLSGRIDQTTSCIIDRRSSTIVYQTVSSNWAHQFATQGITDLVRDIREQSGGRLMNNQTREFILQIRQNAIEATKTTADMSPFEKQAAEQERESIVRQIDDLLAPAWKIGVSFNADANGVYLTKVNPDGPAGRAGLAVGDRIKSVDLRKLPAKESFPALIGNAASQSIRIEVERGGIRLDKTVEAQR